MIQLASLLCVSIDMLIGTEKLVLPEVKNDLFELKESEKNLISTYRKLNREGKQKLCERADELLDLGYIEKGDAAKMAWNTDIKKKEILLNWISENKTPHGCNREAL